MGTVIELGSGCDPPISITHGSAFRSLIYLRPTADAPPLPNAAPPTNTPELTPRTRQQEAEVESRGKHQFPTIKKRPEDYRIHLHTRTVIHPEVATVPTRYRGQQPTDDNYKTGPRSSASSRMGLPESTMLALSFHRQKLLLPTSERRRPTTPLTPTLKGILRKIPPKPRIAPNQPTLFPHQQSNQPSDQEQTPPARLRQTRQHRHSTGHQESTRPRPMPTPPTYPNNKLTLFLSLLLILLVNVARTLQLLMKEQQAEICKCNRVHTSDCVINAAAAPDWVPSPPSLSCVAVLSRKAADRWPMLLPEGLTQIVSIASQILVPDSLTRASLNARLSAWIRPLFIGGPMDSTCKYESTPQVRGATCSRTTTDNSQ